MVRPGTPAGHLAKAEGFLRGVRALRGAGLTERAVSEAYYAAFHLAQALLASAGLSAETHAGVQALLARHFVREGPLPPGAGRAFSHLLTDRLLADYGVDREIDEAGGAEAVAAALALMADLLDALAPRLPDAAPAIADLRRDLAALRAPGADPGA